MLSVITISAFNVQKGMNLSNDIATFGISNMFTLTDASANIVTPSGPCSGSQLCNSGNGQKYSALTSGEEVICCFGLLQLFRS